MPLKIPQQKFDPVTHQKGVACHLMTTNELAELGTQLVNRAAAQGLTLRMSGGVAISLRCPSISTHPSLQRANADLDFYAVAQDWQKISEWMQAQGFTLERTLPQELSFARAGAAVEIHRPDSREDFALDVSSRLEVVPLTLPLADLLLQKLARIDFRDKDIQDATALLADHRVTDGGDEDEDINRAYLYPIVNREYRLWKTVFDNTVTLEKIFDKYLEPEEAQLAWRRIERLQEVFDGKSHSLGWWAGRVLT